MSACHIGRRRFESSHCIERPLLLFETWLRVQASSAPLGNAFYGNPHPGDRSNSCRLPGEHSSLHLEPTRQDGRIHKNTDTYEVAFPADPVLELGLHGRYGV